MHKNVKNKIIETILKETNMKSDREKAFLDAIFSLNKPTTTKVCEFWETPYIYAKGGHKNFVFLNYFEDEFHVMINAWPFINEEEGFSKEEKILKFKIKHNKDLDVEIIHNTLGDIYTGEITLQLLCWENKRETIEETFDRINNIKEIPPAKESKWNFKKNTMN
ncbi:MAG: hypothetical protein ACRC4M_04820 [Mycoplasma sp.]